MMNYNHLTSTNNFWIIKNEVPDSSARASKESWTSKSFRKRLKFLMGRTMSRTENVAENKFYALLVFWGYDFDAGAAEVNTLLENKIEASSIFFNSYTLYVLQAHYRYALPHFFCMYVYIFICIYVSRQVCIYIYVCLSDCLSICMYMYIYIYIYIGIYVCIYICT